MSATLFAANSSRAGAAACEPISPRLSDVAVSAARVGGGSETTEYLAAGAYRVTRCDGVGRVERSMTVAPLPTALASLYVPLSRYTEGGPLTVLIYGNPNDPYWMRRYLRARKSAPARLLRPTAPLPPAASIARRATRSPVTAARRDPGCRDRRFGTLLAGAVWAARGFGWVADVGSLPHGELTLAVYRRGFDSWEHTINDCGLGDQNNVTLPYLGDVGVTSSEVRDGYNSADFGSLPALGCVEPGTIACVLLWTGPNGDLIEVDGRQGTNWRWAHHAIAGRFDVWSIVAHEVGHMLGLNEAAGSNHRYQTMYAFSETGTTNKRTLSKGDILGMRKLYPPR